MGDIEVIISEFRTKFKVKELSGCTKDKSLKILAKNLLSGRLVEEISSWFSSHLYALLEVTVDPEVIQSTDAHFQKICVLLGNLSLKYSDAQKFAFAFFENHPPPYHCHAEEVPPAKKKQKMSQERLIVRATYNLVMADSNIAHGWDWRQFFEFLGSSDPEVRWLCCETLAAVFSLSESQRLQLLSGHLSEEEHRKFLLDMYIEKRIFNAKPHIEQISDVSITKKVVSVCGIDLPVDNLSNVSNGGLIAVKSTTENLRSLALAVVKNAPVLIQGPVGSGKTSLVDHLARVTGRYGTTKYAKIQLGDQTDSKVLVGTYRCTDVPGEFVWQQGILAQAVSEGNWILLEDIDYASMDVISVLVPVLESRTLLVPGHGESIKAAPGFQIFLTQRLIGGSTGFYKQHLGHFRIIERYLRKIHVEPLSSDELKAVIETKYPVLKTIVDRILEVYFSVVPGARDNSEVLVGLKTRDCRLVSTRDVLKWCHRISENFDVQSPVSQYNAFQDALDIFCGSVAKAEARLPMAEVIGGKLNILKAKAEFYVNSHKPPVDVSEKKIVVGRSTLPVLPKEQLYKRMTSYTFSYTRQATLLLERVAVCIRNKEPVLLVGETGCGKTSTVQFLARITNHKLTVVNMNQQSDSADLLGGYKPVEIRHVVAPVRDEFEELFTHSFSRQENAKFLGHVMKTFCAHRWQDLFTLMLHSQKAALKKFKDDQELVKKWSEIGIRVAQLRAQVKHLESALAFAFVEGSLVKAVKNGDWILLDEINLASAETLECLSGLLEGEGNTLALFEKGEREPLKIHPEFRLFSCMNPATDVGKKDLPPGIRNRFTEFFVDEVVSETDLKILVGDYLRGLSITGAQIDGIVKFYLQIRGEAARTLEDGTGHKPHYSLRTLCRALAIAATNVFGSVPRSIYEAFCLSFLTQLDRKSHPVVEEMIATCVMGKKNLKAITSQAIPQPTSGRYVEVEGYWIEQGDNEPVSPDDYIITPTVRANLRDISRIVSASRHPTLLQGETSVGKTSLIVYLAKLSGNVCVRVNNHEHTDIQEYLGAYTADENGKLVFQEGVLVQAMRKGHWIILDELNLAPSDVLEALNRVLDENRELFIAETQETIRAHPRFQVFATQNPPGQYGGRKVLSRAFRNRFVELHFDEIPTNELETILNQRCQLPLSYAKKLVAVHKELQLHRRGSAAFAGKSGFITLRDLFRWAERYRHADVPSGKLYDWDQHMADEGYLVLAGKVRKAEERIVIQQALHKHMKRTVTEDKLFTLNQETSSVTRKILQQAVDSPTGFEHVVWTFEMRRLAVLVGKSFSFKEPVLLVGETGCGKTTISQLFAALSSKHLYAVNCHQHSEAADFLGGLRPVRNRSEDDGKLKLFEWMDGPLVHAMRGGHVFLADEISLADDSVLERLNSVLEPERSLLLAERGTEGGTTTDAVITAEDGFRFVGTMNPGGDYGKKELSPALRNRFTEIWCPLSRKREDLVAIIEHNLKEGVFLCNQQDGSTGIGKAMIDFVEWFASQELGKSLRAPRELRRLAVEFLSNQIATLAGHPVDVSNLISDYTKVHVVSDETKFGINPFFIQRGPANTERNLFKFQAPTTATNVVRVLRSLQLAKPVLLEGSPGVGKTSLVEAMAKAAGYELVRINLSEQTDVSDLFGADLPVEGGSGGQFEWRDGPLLQALKAGHWIVLDELNLASQSVLEGLNAVLDHRGELFIPELGRTFQLDPKKTKLFACQNPQRQGGARKGLPKSFLNRFIQVHVEPLLSSDLQFILKALFRIPEDIVEKMVEFNSRLQHEILELGQWGQKGGPWELNLRDMFRWCEAITKKRNGEELKNPGEFLKLIYADRMRTKKDKEKVFEAYLQVFGKDYPPSRPTRNLFANKDFIQIGNGRLEKCQQSAEIIQDENDLLLLHRNIDPLESLMHCVEMNWMAILVGPHAAGKTSLVSLLSHLTGNPLHVLSMNSSMDTTELLGGFEQSDLSRHLEDLAVTLKKMVNAKVRSDLIEKNYTKASSLLGDFQQYLTLTKNARPKTIQEETTVFKKKIEALKYISKDIGVGDLTDKLDLLLKKIETQNAVSGGGSFEWVDSLFVKALREGHWLLVDNVNFCGASVLDRLNALLEPNGKLVISERGVIDGDVPAVQPHKNFRLFLAMDPQNGEISRAMRNRGVEIYVLGPEEGEPYSKIEARALLLQKGVINQRVQDCLLEFHSSVVGTVTGLEKPSILHLLESSALVVQLSQRSWSVADSLLFACIDVYVRSQRHLPTKRKIKETLDEAYAVWKITDFGKKELYDVIGSHFIPRSLFLQRSSTLSRVLQDSTLLQMLKAPGSFNDIELAALTNFGEFAVSHYFHEATFSDIPLRLEYIAKFDGTYHPFAERLAEYLNSLVNVDDVPMDPRLKMPLEKFVKYDAVSVNRLFLWLQFSCLKWREEVRLRENRGKNVYALGKAIEEGKISAESSPHPIFQVVLPLLSEIDTTVDLLLKNVEFRPDIDEWATLYEAVRWRFCFGEVLVEEISKKSLDLVISRIGQYWKWLDQRLLRKIELLTSSFLSASQRLSGIISQFRESFKSRDERESELATKFLDNYGRPEPFKTVEAAESADQAMRLTERVSIPVPMKLGGDRAFERKIAFLLSEEGTAICQKLIARLSGNDLVQKESLSETERILAELHLETTRQKEEEETVYRFPIKTILQAQILPLLYAFWQRQQQHAFISGLNPDITPILPVAAAKWNQYVNSKCSKNELLYHLLNHNLKSPFESSMKIWTKFKPQDITNEEETQAPTEGSSSISPVISLTCGSQTLSSSEELSKRLDSWDLGQSVQLDSYKEKTEHLRTLATTLWRNMPQLTSNSFDTRLNEARLVISTYQHLTECIADVVGMNGSSLIDNIETIDGELEAKTTAEIASLVRDAAETYCNVKQIVELDERTLAKALDLEILTGQLWMKTGLLGMSLVSSLELIDPVERTRILLKLADLEAEEVHAQISLRRIDSLYKTGLDIRPLTADIHPYVQYFFHRKISLEEMQKELGERVAVRPESSVYESLKKDLTQYVNGIGARKTVENLMTRLTETISIIQKSEPQPADGIRLLLLECKSAINSQMSFMKRLEENYSWYMDIVSPILTNSAKITHGLKLLHNCLSRNYQKFITFGNVSNQVEVVISTIGSFLNYGQSNQLIDLLLGKFSETGHFHELIERSFGTTENSWIVNKLKRNILLAGLLELKEKVYSEGRIEPKTRQRLEEVFEYFVMAWNKSEEERMRKEEEKESLYRTKTHEGETPEEEADLQSIKTMFPTYVNEFEKEPAMDVDDIDESDVAEELVHYIRPEDMSFIVQTHLHLFRKFAENLVVGLPQVAEDKMDATESFRIRYQCVSLLVDQLYPLLDESLDRNLLVSHIMALCLASSPPERKKTTFNIYFDPHPEEAVKLRTLIDGLIGRVEELLEEWPGHPVLSQVLISVRHLLSFPVHSPLMKLLTGLELSLGKCQEWEANAHKGVSLSMHLEALTSLVLDWRKLELSGWKECLNTVEQKAESKSDRWWFHMYGVLMSFLASRDDGPSISEVGIAFRQFLEGSTIGEFSRRLEMLEAFMLHIVVWKPPEAGHEADKKKDDLVRTLWNLHFFFSQHILAVRNRVQAVRSPIEKKVKDFVKIMRWNDINYWSTKDTVNKSHKTLHKHMKEYENALKENVQSVLSVQSEDHVVQGEWDVGQEVKFVDENHLKKLIVAERSLSIETNIEDAINQMPTLQRIPKLFPRSRTIVEDFLKKSKFTGDISVIDDLTGEIIKTVDDLQKLQTVGGPNKEKQLAEARQIHSRKRTALAELFKVLQRLGFSYRRGLSTFVMDQGGPTALDILDVSGNLKSLPKRTSDDLLMSLWSKCPNYQSRRLSRFNSMKVHLQQPSKELGPALIERLKGFAETIMKFADSLWNETATTFSFYVAIRRQIQNIQDATNHSLVVGSTMVNTLTTEYTETISPIGTELEHMMEHLIRFLRVFKCSSTTFCQFPTDGEGDVFSDDQTLNDFYKRIEGELKQLSDARSNAVKTYTFHKLMNEVKESLLLNEKHKDAIGRYCQAIKATNSVTENFIRTSCTKDSVSASFLSPLVAFVRHYEELQPELQRISQFLEKPSEHLPLSGNSLQEFDEALKSALIGIQAVQKKEIKSVDEEDVDEDYELAQNHLTDVMSNLHESVKGLKLEQVRSAIRKSIESVENANTESWKQVLALWLPVMEQFLCFVEYFVLQELSALRATLKFLSVLLGVFDLLAEKGFCLPSELSEELMKEGTSQFEDIESGGLGEGEGAKDVSDQIENEDQLEGAKQKGEEKDEANDDVQEEEGGIEMSEDFEGKQQDVKPNEDDEDNDKSDEDDLDKDMGDTEKGADQLDEEMWGDEDENDEDENEKKEEEGKGDGKTGESQTVAKEDAPEGNDSDEKDDKKDEEKKQKEINEADEQEPNDDQVDPYHGQQEPEPEPEALDLPEDLNLDNAEQPEGEEEEAPQENWDVEATNIEDGKETEENEGEEKEEEMEEEEEKSKEEQPPVEEPPTGEEEGENRDQEKSDEPAEDKDPESAQAVASDDTATEAETQAADTTGKGSADKVQAEAETDAEQGGTNEEDMNKEAEGVGVSQVEQSAGHQGPTSANIESQRDKADEQPERIQKRPGTSDIKRSLAEQSGNAKKRLKTSDDHQSSEREEKEGIENDQKAEAEVYEHIRDSERHFDAETIDAATEEQARERPVAEEEGDKPENQDVDMESDEEIKEQEADKKENEKLQGSKPAKHRKPENDEPSGTEATDQETTIEGEIVQTQGAERGIDTDFFTNVEAQDGRSGLTQEDIEQLRTELENQVSQWSRHQQWNEIDQSEATEAWLKYEAVVGSLAQDLCEQLRLILEPSQASRLRGDYRTGKRLNMRKIIPYIASQFRKDKIWLRRTKPSKRQYQIMLAVDDSSSMADNHSKQLTFESVALISKALTLVEAGELGIVSFGETTRLVHDLSDSFGNQNGGRLLHDLTFAQKKTRIGQMVDFVTAHLLQSRSRLNTPSEVAQLLVVLSDGRGIFSEGQEPVRQAIRRAKEANVFMVFVIIDNPDNKDSILDIRQPVFEGGKLKEIRSYMDQFPFPFYLILRDINSLPVVLSDALRQWFELVTGRD